MKRKLPIICSLIVFAACLCILLFGHFPVRLFPAGQSTTKRYHLPFVYQESSHSCGIAALSSILSFYGVDTTYEKIASLIGFDSSGTTMYQLSEGAKLLGFEAVGLFLDASELRKVRKPLIAHVNGNHFVVVASYKKDKLTVLDPAVGERIMTMEGFSNIFTGYVLLVFPKRSG